MLIKKVSILMMSVSENWLVFFKKNSVTGVYVSTWDTRRFQSSQSCWYKCIWYNPNIWLDWLYKKQTAPILTLVFYTGKCINMSTVFKLNTVTYFTMSRFDACIETRSLCFTTVGFVLAFLLFLNELIYMIVIWIHSFPFYGSYNRM